MARENFEFRRHVDGSIYAFEKLTGSGKEAIYERSDKAVRVLHDAKYGWSIWSVEGALLSRAWDILPDDQGDYPPEGIWVSRKGSKSYVYDLVYVTS